MTIDEFEKEVLEEISIFVADWLKAQSLHGTYEFPYQMDQGDWWNQFMDYDKNMPFSEKNDV